MDIYDIHRLRRRRAQHRQRVVDELQPSTVGIAKSTSTAASASSIIMLLGRDVHVKCILVNMPAQICPVRHRLYGAPPDLPQLHDRATATHTSALGVRGKRIAADARLGERSTLRGAVLRTDRPLPGKRADPLERRDFATLPERYLSRVLPHTICNKIIHTRTSTLIVPTLNEREIFHTTFKIEDTTM